MALFDQAKQNGLRSTSQDSFFCEFSFDLETLEVVGYDGVTIVKDFFDPPTNTKAIYYLIFKDCRFNSTYNAYNVVKPVDDDTLVMQSILGTIVREEPYLNPDDVPQVVFLTSRPVVPLEVSEYDTAFTAVCTNYDGTLLNPDGTCFVSMFLGTKNTGGDGFS